MTSKKALSILREHKALLDDEKYEKFFPWQQQTISYVDKFLGKESQEYKSINGVEFPKMPYTDNDLKLLRTILQTNIDQSINTIDKIGIYRIYHNFWCKYSDKELIAGIIAVGAAIFWAGYGLANFVHHWSSPK